MFYAAARYDLHLPECQSLKDKRSLLLQLKSRIANRHQCSVAEVDGQDLWQRGSLGVALVVSSHSSGQDALAAILREIETKDRVSVLDAKTLVANIEDDDEWDVYSDTSKERDRG